MSAADRLRIKERLEAVKADINALVVERRNIRGRKPGPYLERLQTLKDELAGLQLEADELGLDFNSEIVDMDKTVEKECASEGSEEEEDSNDGDETSDESKSTKKNAQELAVDILEEEFAKAMNEGVRQPEKKKKQQRSASKPSLTPGALRMPMPTIHSGRLDEIERLVHAMKQRFPPDSMIITTEGKTKTIKSGNREVTYVPPNTNHVDPIDADILLSYAVDGGDMLSAPIATPDLALERATLVLPRVMNPEMYIILSDIIASIRMIRMEVVKNSRAIAALKGSGQFGSPALKGSNVSSSTPVKKPAIMEVRSTEFKKSRYADK